jgi:hypothetical protein
VRNTKDLERQLQAEKGKSAQAEDEKRVLVGTIEDLKAQLRRYSRVINGSRRQTWLSTVI